MRRMMITVLSVLVGVVSASAANAQSCADGMAQNMQQMADMALQCGESAELMNSLRSGGSGGLGFDRLAGMCSSGVSVSSQLEAFNECSRTYVCAVLAYGYALENLPQYGGDCTAAANAGLAEFPIR